MERWSAANFVDNVVVPCVRDFRDQPKSQRHAYIACIVLYHLVDYVEADGEPDAKSKIKSASPTAYDAIRGVCNGVKHSRLKQHHKIPFQPGQDWYRPPAIFGVAQFGISRFGDKTGGREYRTDVGNIDIYPTIKSLLATYKTTFPNLLGDSNIEDC